MVGMGSKRSREGTLKQGSVPNQIIWKRDSKDVKQDSLDSVASMGDFVGENYDLVSNMNKEVEEKEKELQR